jgi:hypothetical protein
LTQEPGGDILTGTGELDRTLLEHGLIDEFHFWVPVLAGTGTRLTIEGIDAMRRRVVNIY